MRSRFLDMTKNTEFWFGIDDLLFYSMTYTVLCSLEIHYESCGSIFYLIFFYVLVRIILESIGISLFWILV